MNNWDPARLCYEVRGRFLRFRDSNVPNPSTKLVDVVFDEADIPDSPSIDEHFIIVQAEILDYQDKFEFRESKVYIKQFHESARYPSIKSTRVEIIDGKRRVYEFGPYTHW